MAKRDLLSLQDLTAHEILELIKRGQSLKTHSGPVLEREPLRGKTLGLLFEKSSTRTRVSFETAMYQLGGHAIYLSMGDLQVKRGETISDTARVLSRYLDGLVIRTFTQDTLMEWACSATIPIINGLTDLHHPCQALGDLLTLYERFGVLKGMKLAYVGDGNNVAHSLIEGAAKVGMTIHLACPKAYEPDPNIVSAAQRESKRAGGSIELFRDPYKAATGADVLYTDVWVSMGKERETRRRLKLLKPYQINNRLLAAAKPNAVVMHCLPAHRGQEITSEIMDGPQSIVWDQAENRLHIQKAILEWLMG
jgi:ornithine carbamoyltransferase